MVLFFSVCFLSVYGYLFKYFLNGIFSKIIFFYLGLEGRGVILVLELLDDFLVMIGEGLVSNSKFFGFGLSTMACFYLF